ncbi:helitron_like_N domain-containing protein [Trichonephila clavipes]|nr:helitron_like_N domain-containing protein [Trichonephila clavipes]
MPRKKSNLNNASTREARRKRIKRAHQLAEQIESRNLAQRISTAEGHAQESQEQCNERLQENIIRTRAAGERDIATSNATEKSNLNNASSKGSRRKRVERAQQLPEQIETRNAAQRIRTAESRARESQEQRDERLQQNITRTSVARERNIATILTTQRIQKIAIGGMDKVCQYCHALKFRNEAAGMCCASGKVVLSPLPAPPEPLLSLLTGNSDDSKLFLRKIRKFNSCFQMTSFGATKICDRASDGRNFETTFKIQGQVYHKIGSLMPMPDNNPKFLQIYFMGDCEERVTTRCLYNFIEQAEERAIVILLENFLEDHNQLIQLIKRVSPRLQNDNYQIVIKADKVPLGEHAGRFNAPTVDEVAVIMVGDPVDKRSIKNYTARQHYQYDFGSTPFI